MMKKAALLAVTATGLMLTVHFFFGFIYTCLDSYFFHAFAQYLRTGKYVFPILNLPYKHIHTGSPPLYSGLLAILYSFGRADILLHLIQLLMLVVSAFLIYKILRHYINKSWAVVIACLFVWIPGNVIYASYVMSDLGGEFLLILYCYFVFLYLITKKINYLGISIFVGFAGGLWRYPQAEFGVISLLLFIFKHPKGIKHYFFPTLGVLVIMMWLWVQHTLTGSFSLGGLSDLSFYNLQVMVRAKALPPEDHPATAEIRKYIPKEVDLRQPYWELEKYFIPYFGYDYIKLSKLVGDVGKAALWAHPVAVAGAGLDSFYQSNFEIPYDANLATFGLNYSINFPPLYCNKLETIELCKPIIKTKYSFPVWNNFVKASNLFYHTLFPFWTFIIFFPLLIYSLFSSNSVLKIFSLFYLFGRFTVALATYPTPRYVLPFYPLMVIITSLAIVEIASKLRKKKWRILSLRSRGK